jgi:hypothetical protein
MMASSKKAPRAAIFFIEKFVIAKIAAMLRIKVKKPLKLAKLIFGLY